MGKPELALRPGARNKPTFGSPAANTDQSAVDRSFAAYVAGRPDPLDGVERFLLRLSWLVWRVTHRREQPPRGRPKG